MLCSFIIIPSIPPSIGVYDEDEYEAKLGRKINEQKEEVDQLRYELLTCSFRQKFHLLLNQFHDANTHREGWRVRHLIKIASYNLLSSRLKCFSFHASKAHEKTHKIHHFSFSFNLLVHRSPPPLEAALLQPTSQPMRIEMKSNE